MSSADYFTRVQASPGWARVLASFARFAARSPFRGPQAGWRTLDVGCGPGALVRHLSELACQAHGIDSDPAMPARARDLAPGLSFCAGDARALPFGATSFDLVTATNVLFLLPDPLAALREMARVCRPGGQVAVLNPSPRLSRAAAEAHAARVGLTGFDLISFVNWGAIAERHARFSSADLENLFGSAGLQPPEIAEKIGSGLALFAKGRRPP